MDRERQMGSAHVQSQLDVESTPYLRSVVEGRRITQTYPSGTSLSRHSNSAMFPSVQPTREIVQYQSSVATQKLGHFSVDSKNLTQAESRSTTDPTRFPPNPPAYFDGAFTDPSLSWSRSAYETTLQEMHKELSAVHVNRSRQSGFWPMDVAARLPEQNGLPFQQVGFGNRGVPTDIEHLQVHGQPLSYPFANRYAAPGVERIGYPLDQDRDSAFTKPQAHTLPASCSPLDLEIRRLQGMITRVEMLREKYKYQEGSLKYPKSPADAFRPGQPFGQNSGLASCCVEQWKGRDVESMSRLPNGYVFPQDASRMYAPKQNEWVSQRPKYPAGPRYQVHGAYPPKNYQEGMPRIVDVRSLAQEQALYAEKMNRRCMMPTESVRETGSVESLDSGVDCMASPTDIPTHRSIATAPVRFKHLEEIHLKDLVPIRQEYIQPASRNKVAGTRTTSPTSLHVEHRPNLGLPTSPLTSPSRKRHLPRCAFENEIKRVKNEGSSTRLPKYVYQEHGISGANDCALDLSVKKKPAHELHGQHGTHETPIQLLNSKAKNKIEAGPINLSARAAAVGPVHKRHSLGSTCPAGAADCCPPGLLHHHGKSSSMEDLVALSVKLANEVPAREGGFQSSVKKGECEQELACRGQFITKLIQKAEDMLQRPKSLSNEAFSFCPEPKRSSFGIVKESRSTIQNKPARASPQEKHLHKDLDESNPKPRVPGGKNPLYIDVMVSEALRVFRSPPSEDELEKRGQNKPVVCNSPEERVIGRDDSEKETCEIPSAATLLAKTKKPKESGSMPVDENEKDSLAQKEKQSTETPMQNNYTPVSQTHTSTKVTSADTTGMVQPYRAIAPKPGKKDKIVHGQSWFPPKTTAEFPSPFRQIMPCKGFPLAQPETAHELYTSVQSGQLSKRPDIKEQPVDTCHSAPSFLIPTEDGFRRMQKVDSKIREIYRVTVLRVEGVRPLHPPKQPPRVIYSVYYREMSFPCVLRSEVPFVPTQLLVQDLFPGMEASRIFKAMQQCNILNRYMIRHEQETLQEQLGRRGITSCKLLPLDEFHDKWSDILNLVHGNDQSEESQIKLTQTRYEGYEH